MPQHKILSKNSYINSLLAKLLKFPTLSITLMLLPLSKSKSYTFSTQKPIIKIVYKKSYPIINKCPYWLQKPSQKTYNILKDYTIMAIKKGLKEHVVSLY